MFLLNKSDFLSTANGVLLLMTFYLSTANDFLSTAKVLKLKMKTGDDVTAAELPNRTYYVCQ